MPREPGHPAVGQAPRAQLPDAGDHDLLAARRDGTFGTRLRTYTQPTVLVIDDVGPLPIDAEGAGVFFHVVNARFVAARAPTLPLDPGSDRARTATDSAQLGGLCLTPLSHST